MKIKEYLIGTIKNLNYLIDQGYKPYGNPLSHDGSFIQAMVKYEEEKIPENNSNNIGAFSYDANNPICIKFNHESLTSTTDTIQVEIKQSDVGSSHVKWDNITKNEEQKKHLNKPWLDWNENTPYNKPKEDVNIIVIFKENYKFKFDTCFLIAGQFVSSNKTYNPSIIEKWAYIPE
jgi:hypothetical protein